MKYWNLFYAFQWNTEIYQWNKIDISLFQTVKNIIFIFHCFAELLPVVSVKMYTERNECRTQYGDVFINDVILCYTFW